MGSVSDSVVRHAHCPVLVVRGGESGQAVLLSKKILLATDGSEDGLGAARCLRSLQDSSPSPRLLLGTGGGGARAAKRTGGTRAGGSEATGRPGGGDQGGWGQRGKSSPQSRKVRRRDHSSR